MAFLDYTGLQRFLRNLDATMSYLYDNTETYDAGEYCINDAKFYRCKVDITVPENFTAAHWDEIKLTDEFYDGLSVVNGQLCVTYEVEVDD